MLLAPAKGTGSQGSIRGVTRLEKLLFLADQEVKLPEVEDRPEFVPYHYGPYSKAVYEDVELLEEADLVREEREIAGQGLDRMEEAEAAGSDVEWTERRFFLTEAGRAVAGRLATDHPTVYQAFTKLKMDYGSLSLNRLLSHVYEQYPNFTGASRIREQVLGQ